MQRESVNEKMNMKRNSYLIVLFLLFWGLEPDKLPAQNVEAIGTLSTDTVVPGQQFGFELNIKVPENFQVKWPVFADTLSASIEIISRNTTETSAPDTEGNKILRQQFVLTTFDTGWAYLPGINIQFAPEGDTSFYLAQSNPLMLRVQPVNIDTTAVFKPIKDNEGIPLTFAEIFPWIIGSLGIAALIAGLIWLLRKRKPSAAAPKVVIKQGLPPHVIAIDQLEQLRLEKLWQQGQLKQYYTRLSDIIRMYIEAQFPVNAVEMTTHEILASLKPLDINDEAMNKLALTLELSDLVKFAKAQPTGMENDMSLNHLIDFVNESYGSTSAITDGVIEKESVS